MTQEQMEVGDYAVHGEEPYTFAHYNIKHDLPLLRRRTTTLKRGDEEMSKGGVLVGKDPSATVERTTSSGDSIKEIRDDDKGVSSGRS